MAKQVVDGKKQDILSTQKHKNTRLPWKKNGIKVRQNFLFNEENFLISKEWKKHFYLISYNLCGFRMIDRFLIVKYEKETLKSKCNTPVYSYM